VSRFVLGPPQRHKRIECVTVVVPRPKHNFLVPNKLYEIRKVNHSVFISVNLGDNLNKLVNGRLLFTRAFWGICIGF
jgi:hypothetical protein